MNLLPDIDNWFSLAYSLTLYDRRDENNLISKDNPVCRLGDVSSSRLAVTSQHYKPSKGNVGSFETRGVNSEFDSRVSVRPSNRPNINSLVVSRSFLGFSNSIHQEVASDSFCFLINSSWLLVFILFLFLHALGLNLYCWNGIHFS